MIYSRPLIWVLITPFSAFRVHIPIHFSVPIRIRKLHTFLTYVHMSILLIRLQNFRENDITELLFISIISPAHIQKIYKNFHVLYIFMNFVFVLIGVSINLWQTCKNIAQNDCFIHFRFWKMKPEIRFESQYILSDVINNVNIHTHNFLMNLFPIWYVSFHSSVLNTVGWSYSYIITGKIFSFFRIIEVLSFNDFF